MPKFPFYMDTHPAALEVFIDLQRKMPPGKKAAQVFEMCAMLLRLSETGVRMIYPNAGDREVFLRAAARRLDRETMIRAYGWDPQEHGGRT